MSNRYWLDLPDEVEAEIAKTPNRVRPQIKREIADLRDNPRPAHAKAMRNYPDRYRITIDDHRIYYRVDDEALIVHLLKVGKKHGPEFYQP
mgnify:CR=1 FL=1